MLPWKIKLLLQCLEDGCLFAFTLTGRHVDLSSVPIGHEGNTQAIVQAQCQSTLSTTWLLSGQATSSLLLYPPVENKHM